MSFGVSDPRDPALQDIARLKREFPGRRIEVLVLELERHTNELLTRLYRGSHS